MRVLQIGSDRSKRGILYPGSASYKRQEAYAKEFGALDIIGFSLRTDSAKESASDALRVYPTNSSSRLMYVFDAMRIAKRLQRPDVVSVQDPFEVGFIGWLIARLLGVRLHVQVHTDFLSLAYAQHSLLNRIRVYIAGFVLRRAKRVRVVSGKIKDSIEKKYQLTAPVTVLPIFVDVEKIKNTSSTSSNDPFLRKFKYKLLVVARNTPEKNIVLALKSFKKVAPSDACLTVFYTGDHPENIYSDDSRIQCFLGMDASHYYKNYDLVLVPSLYEGYGLVIIEALAAGKPVLSTDVGIAREAGAIVTSPEKFADALSEWFKNGSRTGELKGYPYKDFQEYVHAYCRDIVACADPKKGQ